MILSTVNCNKDRLPLAHNYEGWMQARPLSFSSALTAVKDLRATGWDESSTMDRAWDTGSSADNELKTRPKQPPNALMSLLNQN